MNKKIKIGMILIIYIALAGIPSVMGYFQYKIIKETNDIDGRCGSCHVDPNSNSSLNINISNQTNQVSKMNTPLKTNRAPKVIAKSSTYNGK